MEITFFLQFLSGHCSQHNYKNLLIKSLGLSPMIGILHAKLLIKEEENNFTTVNIV